MLLARLLFSNIGKITDKHEAVFRISLSTLSAMFVAFHIVFILFFIVIHQIYVVLPINIICILLYTLAILMNRHKANAAAGVIFSFAPSLYAVACIYLVGWELGAQWYLIALIAPVYMINEKFAEDHRKLCLAILAFAMVLVCYMTFFLLPPLGMGEPFVIMQFLNIFLSIVTGVAAAGVFSFCNSFNSLSEHGKLNMLSGAAKIDGLTNIYSKKYFENVLVNVYRDEEVDRKRIYLAAINIDNFRLINEEYGNKFGDIVLKYFAEVMTTSFRSTDVSARWGGDTFVVLLHDTDENGAITALEKFKSKLEETELIIHEWQYIELKVTIGFVSCDFEDSHSESIKCADEALVYGKKNGRNIIVNYNDIS